MLPVITLFVVAFLPVVWVWSRLAYSSFVDSRRVRPAKKASAADAAIVHLSTSKAAAVRVAFAVQGSLLSVGWLLFIIGASSWVLPYEVWPVPFLSLMPLWPAGLTITLLAIRPTDKIGTLLATTYVQGIALFFIFNLISFMPWASLGVGTQPGHIVQAVVVALVGINHLIQIGFLCLNYRCTPPVSPRTSLSRTWRSYRLLVGAMLVFFATLIISPPPPVDDREAAASADPRLTADAEAEVISGVVVSFVFVLVVFGLRPSVRRRFHSFLGSIAAKNEVRAAAAVAGLVGGRNPSEALMHGAASFRGLPFDQLSSADLSSSGDTGLHAKTVKLNLGEVDAFFSHSWHDDAAQKWTALSEWAAAQPKNAMLWLDKACIDQLNIEQSLAALPIYLSGCQSLLVVAGHTYTSRLWCVMELFTFVQMGGDIERVHPIALPGKDVQRELATFDASKATCFNGKVRTIFRKRGLNADHLQGDVAPADELS